MKISLWFWGITIRHCHWQLESCFWNLALLCTGNCRLSSRIQKTKDPNNAFSPELWSWGGKCSWWLRELFCPELYSLHCYFFLSWQSWHKSTKHKVVLAIFNKMHFSKYLKLLQHFNKTCNHLLMFLFYEISAFKKDVIVRKRGWRGQIQTETLTAFIIR